MSDPLVQIEAVRTTLDGAMLEPGPGQGGVFVGKDATATHLRNLVIRAQPGAAALSTPMQVPPAKPSFGQRAGDLIGSTFKGALNTAVAVLIKKGMDGT